MTTEIKGTAGVRAAEGVGPYNVTRTMAGDMISDAGAPEGADCHGPAAIAMTGETGSRRAEVVAPYERNGKKLQILVPHYHEDAAVIRPLLDSIAIQQNVDFSEIGVIICHDGAEIGHFVFDDDRLPFDTPDLPAYPFEIRQINIPHKGVSAARNACLDAATAEYVMFCDADDMFFSACALWVLFREMQGDGFDGLVSLFVEETRHPQTGEVVYLNRENDSTFVHGKVWRLEYLIENGIRWNEALQIHEDSYFNSLAINLSEKVKDCPISFYLWRWREDSVCRHDPKYMLKTYRNFIDSNDALVDEYLRRGKDEMGRNLAAFMIFDAYYTMNKPEWINQENREYRAETERRFSAYYRKHGELWRALDPKEKMRMSNGVRTRNVKEGMGMEEQTIDEWLRHVEGME